MLALDVDGTIAGPDHTVSDVTRAAIREAVDAGVTVVIATGRMRRSAIRYAEMCGVNGPIISYGGALTVAADHVSDLHHERLSQELVGAALERMRSAGAHINVYIDDEIFVENASSWAEGYAGRMSVRLRVVGSLDEVAGYGPTVVMAVDEPCKTAALALELQRGLGSTAAVTHSLPQFCEVASADAVKDVALRRIAEDLGFDATEVIAAGDGLGDVAMLRWAGHGVAVEDAHPDAIAVADTVVPGPERDGVAGLIRDLLSRGKLGA